MLTAQLSKELEELATHLRSRLVAIRSDVGGGSGTPLGDSRTVVTSNHVVPGDRAEVVTHEHRVLAATVVARDEENDLAVLRVEDVDVGLDLFEASDADLRTGHLVFAAGNPWGQRGSVTAGIVLSVGSAVVEGRIQFKDVVLADLRLAPGNSGGPMVDAAGRVVGINAMIAGGMGVAVPVAKALALLGEGMVPRGVLGVVARPVELPQAIAASYPAAGGAGLMITDISPGSPAENAGLLPGDLLVGLDGERGDVSAIARRLGRLRAGRAVRLSLLRGGRETDIEAVPEVA